MICGLGVLALAIAGVAFATLNGDATTPSVQAADSALGVDVTTAGNTASALGPIDSCRTVNVGDADFDVDVYITDASGLIGWSVYLTYDPARLSVANFSTSFMEPQFSASYDYGNGLLYLASAQTQPGGASGLGVLARITFHAVSNGSSALHIRTDGLYVPYLNNDQFSGSVSDAQIAIGQECGVPTTTPTPSPTTVITPSLPPTSTFTPTPTPTPTPSPTPLPTLPPTPAPTGAPPIRGDGDCNGLIELPDVLAALAYASNTHTGSACQGRTDTDCDGVVTANDVLRLLRFLAGDALPQPAGCAQIGSPLSG